MAVSRAATHNTVGVRALKQNASAVLRTVSQGESVTVTDRGQPMAEIIPLIKSPAERLLARGLIRQGKLSWSNIHIPPAPTSGSTASEILAHMRDEERH